MPRPLTALLLVIAFAMAATPAVRHYNHRNAEIAHDLDRYSAAIQALKSIKNDRVTVAAPITVCVANRFSAENGDHDPHTPSDGKCTQGDFTVSIPVLSLDADGNAFLGQPYVDGEKVGTSTVFP